MMMGEMTKTNYDENYGKDEFYPCYAGPCTLPAESQVCNIKIDQNSEKKLLSI